MQDRASLAISHGGANGLDGRGQLSSAFLVTRASRRLTSPHLTSLLPSPAGSSPVCLAFQRAFELAQSAAIRR